MQKSLYGHKQAPHAWFLWLSSFLLMLGFWGSTTNTSLSILHTLDYLVHLWSTRMTLFSQDPWTHCYHLSWPLFIRSLQIGVEVRPYSGGLFLTQTKYIHDMVSRNSILERKPSPSPVTSGSRLSVSNGDLLNEPSLYWWVVNSF